VSAFSILAANAGKIDSNVFFFRVAGRALAVVVVVALSVPVDLLWSDLST
jgi:hypothetical protein